MSPSEIDVFFNTVSGASSYTIYVSSNNSTWNVLVSGLTTNHYADTGLSPFTTLYFYVVAVNSGGSSTHSSTVEATTT
jgi:hypothetical protein